MLKNLFCGARQRLIAYPLDVNKLIIFAGTTSEMSWGSERMKNRHYILLFAGAIVWMVIVWIPFNDRPSIALFLSAIYCTVAACMVLVSMAVEIGARRRQVEIQKTGERYKKITRAIEANRSRRLEKARNLETSGRYEEAARMYDELEMYEKAGECRRMAKPQESY